MSKMVHRTLDFFEAFAAQRRPLLLTELMRVLDIPASSCHDVLHALELRGYLYETRPRAGFYPTARLLDLARQIAEHDPLLMRVEPLLQQLRDDVDESVFLSKAQGSLLRYLLSIEGGSPLRLSIKAGDTIRAVHATSAGKALLGSMAADQRDALLSKLPFKALTPHTITSKTALLRDLDASQARGWYLNREESVEDVLTLSAPFRWNAALHVVTVAGSVTRMERKLDVVSARLCAMASDLSN